jgi:putative ABC transport system permease protein
MLRDIFQEAYVAMRHNRRRTALTMLGMAWGIATVVMLLAYGDGFGRAIANIFAAFGTKMMIVVPGRSTMQAGGQKAGEQLRITLDDVDMLASNIPQITHITPSSSKDATVQYENRTYTLNVIGEYPITYNIRAMSLDQGRFYNAQDQMQRARVAVIGPEVKEKLFSGRNAIGERIRVNGISFEVIGIYSNKMQEGDNNINRLIFVPFTTMGDVKDTHYLDSIWFNYETNEFESLEQTVRYVMAAQHKFNPADRRALMIFNLMVQLHQFEVITLGLKILLTFIGTITLGIGGVGLMNIMLVSVTQRTREIGVEKALGARRGARDHPGLWRSTFRGQAHALQRHGEARRSRRYPPHDQPEHADRGGRDPQRRGISQRHGTGHSRLPPRPDRSPALRIEIIAGNGSPGPTVVEREGREKSKGAPGLLTAQKAPCSMKFGGAAPTCKQARPRRLARPRTSPFHGGNTGSNPVGDANETDSVFLNELRAALLSQINEKRTIEAVRKEGILIVDQSFGRKGCLNLSFPCVRLLPRFPEVDDFSLRLFHQVSIGTTL